MIHQHGAMFVHVHSEKIKLYNTALLSVYACYTIDVLILCILGGYTPWKTALLVSTRTILLFSAVPCYAQQKYRCIHSRSHAFSTKAWLHNAMLCSVHYIRGATPSPRRRGGKVKVLIFARRKQRERAFPFRLLQSRSWNLLSMRHG